MKKWYVFFNDGYPEDGFVGMDSFEHKEKAIEFIEQRIKQNAYADLSMYTLIYGKEIQMKAVEKVTKIRTLND